MGFYVCLTHVQRERHAAANNNSDCTARFKCHFGIRERKIFGPLGQYDILDTSLPKMFQWNA